MTAIVADADAVNPRLTVGWLDYAQHAGFVTDTARVRPPKDKPRVERTVQYVRANSSGPGRHSSTWPTRRPAAGRGARDGPGSGSTAPSRPARRRCSPNAKRRCCCRCRPPMTCRCSSRCKVHRDFHLEVGKALYSMPKAVHRPARGRAGRLDAGQAVSTWTAGEGPSAATARWASDRPGRPARGARSATRCGTWTGSSPPPAARRRRRASTPNGCSTTSCPGPGCGRSTGCSALARRYGDDPVNTACGKALEVDVVSVTKIASMLERATETTARRRRRPPDGRRPVRPRPRRVRHRPTRPSGTGDQPAPATGPPERTTG